MIGENNPPRSPSQVIDRLRVERSRIVNQLDDRKTQAVREAPPLFGQVSGTTIGAAEFVVYCGREKDELNSGPAPKCCRTPEDEAAD